ncbi:sensor histidine kinase [Ammoniphilus resinae]|uniref:histidine kinase n=1 Tax=Ammoniphilus resinae TaxID=861532 RepID=A0ABS4GT32_9BACL|nr:ATP-binding protein [Ammoniphilus resinae]MBP1933433.1 signal transduction histidine kinase [Ammoniphilus resinae]
MPIRLKLALWYSGVFLIIITLFCTFIYLFFTHREMNQIDNHLSERAIEVHHSIKLIDIYPFPIQSLVLPNIDVFSSPEILLQIVDPKGNVLSRSNSLGNQTLPISKRAIEEIRQNKDYYETSQVHGYQFRIYYLPLISGEKLIGVLEVAGSLKNIQRSMTNLQWLLAIGAVLTATFSAIIGWFLAGKSLNPIHKIIQTTKEIEKEGRLERRISYQGPMDEIGLLSGQINSMMEKIETMYRELEESYETQRRFVADASHELRTPLTSIRGNMEFLRMLYLEKGELSMDAMEDIIEEIERVSRMIHNLLALARADAGYKMQMEEIELKDWVSEWINQVTLLSTDTVPFLHDPLAQLEGVSIRGNRDFLQQVFLILFENAFKYTKVGSVGLHFTTTEQNVIFTVQDTGVGIPTEELDLVFRRFHRGANARKFPGTGLGLSIAKWVVEKHGGTIEIQSILDQGTKVSVTLPRI